jgi:head-tail adaptor
MNLGAQRNLVTVDNPGTPTPDGDGGYVLTYVAADPPEWWAAIARAGVAASERLFAGTVLTQASYILQGRFHEAITTETRLTWTDRAGVVHVTNVLDVTDPEGAGVETIALCAERSA